MCVIILGPIVGPHLGGSGVLPVQFGGPWGVAETWFTKPWFWPEKPTSQEATRNRNSSAWPCLQMLVVKKNEIVFEIPGAKCEKVRRWANGVQGVLAGS